MHLTAYTQRSTCICQNSTVCLRSVHLLYLNIISLGEKKVGLCWYVRPFFRHTSGKTGLLQSWSIARNSIALWFIDMNLESFRGCTPWWYDNANDHYLFLLLPQILTFSVGVHPEKRANNGWIAKWEVKLSLFEHASKRPFSGCVCQRQTYHSFLERKSTFFREAALMW